MVNVGSQAGLSGSPTQMGGCSHYGTSKAALHGLTKIMALEYAPNKIRINAVAPTAIETNLVKVGKISKDFQIQKFTIDYLIHNSI